MEELVPAYDMMEIFIVPYLLDDYDIELEYFWVDCDATGVNMFKHWYNVSLQQVILFQSNS